MKQRMVQCRRGGMAMLVGLLIIPMVAITGFGIDLLRLWLLQNRLQTAVDAAALVAGREANTPTQVADAIALFWSNFGRTDKAAGTGFLGAKAGTPTITAVDADTYQVRASAVLGSTLMGVLGQGAVTVGAVASAKRAQNGMEIALVLDITGSMKTNNNIAGLRTAAGELIDILFGPSETQRNLFMSIVPFVASVNLGASHAGWLAPGSLDTSKFGTSGWAGCVEARLNGEDATDTPPQSAPFRPFLWASTNGKYSNAGKPVAGDNDWTAAKITEQLQVTLPDNTAVGPNLSCPAVPVQPLTSSKTTVKATVAALQATFRGGTTGNLGLQAGWFTLSPRWAGLWGSSGSPLPYGTPYMQKVVVMMTDGNNEWYDWNGGAPGSAPTAYDGQKVDADYTAYGRLSENRIGIAMPNTGNIGNDLGTANARVRAELNARTTNLCTQMKQKGIVIYTVILGSLDSATEALWQGCATKPENYFNSPDKAALSSAFQQIGTQLASLRLTQ